MLLFIKVLLFLLTAGAIVYLFPRGGQFKYDFAQGKPWQYDNLYSPFDFAIYKGDNEIEKEKERLRSESKKYFAFDDDIRRDVITEYKEQIDRAPISDSLTVKDIDGPQKTGNLYHQLNLSIWVYQ